jgi:hypothetical protein
MRRMGTRESTSVLQVLLGIAALSANLRGTTDMAMCRLVVNSCIVNPNNVLAEQISLLRRLYLFLTV